jgi:L-ascorbate metabolism protein UlaG (beta-lactamase superfamily)
MAAASRLRKGIRMLLFILGLALSAVALLAFVTTDNFSNLGGKASGKRLERIKSSPNYNGKKFVNSIETSTTPTAEEAIGMIKEVLFGKQERVPKKEIPIVRLRKDTFETPTPEGLRLTWMGHSTVLIEIDGKRILTDPVFGERCSPSSIVGPKRFHPTPIALEDLPELDAVIVSHDHADHLEKNSVVHLAATGVRFYVPLGVGAHFVKWGIPSEQIVELDWWENADDAGGSINIVATPARHFSGRSIGPNQTLWASWAIIGPNHRVFFSGDTGFFDGFTEIGNKYGPFDLTMIKIGAYDKGWPDIHVNPEQAVRAHQALKGKLLLPIHWGTFNLAFHNWFDPPEWVTAEAAKSDVRLATPKPGQTVDAISPGEFEPWWENVKASNE